jgi:adenylosuccinate synthase
MVRDGLVSQRQPRTAAGLEPINEDQVIATFTESTKQLAEFIGDTVVYLNEKLDQDASILAEGAQAFLLDIDHGMYPFTTSSTTTAGGVGPGLGVAPQAITRTIGVAKVVQSHVGGGPFVTEITDEKTLAQLHGDTSAIDAERGATTGRTRRLGYLDLPSIRRAQMVNGTTEIALTKLDWLPRFGETIPVCTHYTYNNQEAKIAPDSATRLIASTPVYEKLPNWTEDISAIRDFEKLPENAQKFVQFIEAQTGLPVTMIGVGPERSQVIVP